MNNKWSLFKDSDDWQYCFPVIEIERRGLSYPDLLRAFIIACHTSGISELRYRGKESNTFPMQLENMLLFTEELKSKNKYGSYPQISTRQIYNLGAGIYEDYVFDNGLYVYDREGTVVKKKIIHSEMKPMLAEIGHGQADDTGRSLPFEFSTSQTGTNNKIESHNFVISFHSDIWLDEVNCIHCFQDCTVEEYEALGGFAKVLEMRYDNSELALLNRQNMNNFLTQMKQVCADFGGEIAVEQEVLSIYINKFGQEGFIL